MTVKICDNCNTELKLAPGIGLYCMNGECHNPADAPTIEEVPSVLKRFAIGRLLAHGWTDRENGDYIKCGPYRFINPYQQP